jgi:hypothetical protein
MSMHSDHHPHSFVHDFDGTMWPAIWVAAIMGAIAVFAWAMS